MRQCYLIVLIIGLMTSMLWSQTNNRSIMAPAGQEDISGEIIVNWTLGEWQVDSKESKGFLYTEGFHQPELNHFAVRETGINLNFSIEISPNPVNQILHINTQAKEDLSLHLVLYDMSGRRLIPEAKINTSGKMDLDMSFYTSGIYVVYIWDDEGTYSESFKITKIK